MDCGRLKKGNEEEWRDVMEARNTGGEQREEINCGERQNESRTANNGGGLNSQMHKERDRQRAKRSEGI